jgi:hypothetical protein
MRFVRRVGALGALATLALVAAPPATAQTPEVTSVIGSADGLFAQLLDVSFGPEPSVALPPEGGSVSDEVVDLEEELDGLTLSAALVEVAAEGELGPDGFATAETSVADLALEADVRLVTEVATAVQVVEPKPQLISVETITGTCEADLDGVSGSTSLVNANVFGEDLSGEPEPNTPFGPIAFGGASVSGTLNHQVENADGSLSVTPLVLEVVAPVNGNDGPPVAVENDHDGDGDVVFTLRVGPATCGVVEGEQPADGEPTPAQPVVVTPVFTG